MIYRTEQQNMQNRTAEYAEQNNKIYRTEQQNMQNSKQNIKNRTMGSHNTEYALIAPLTYERWPEDGLKKDRNMLP
jgi:hypothetical protein